LHQNIVSHDPKRYLSLLQESFTMDFNRRHDRRGRLFDDNIFTLKLDGPNHTQMSFCYGLRQGLHHGQSQTAFDYPWSSCNSLFRAARGLMEEKIFYSNRQDIKSLLPRKAEFPDNWCADKDGILLRSCFENLALVQTWFGTARSFLTAMNRKSSEEWIREQYLDNNSQPPITLNMLEIGYDTNEINAMLTNEWNPKFVLKKMSDTELCKVIDTQLLQKYGVTSVYKLSQRSKLKLYENLRHEYTSCDPKQIARCLALNYWR